MPSTRGWDEYESDEEDDDDEDTIYGTRSRPSGSMRESYIPQRFRKRLPTQHIPEWQPIPRMESNPTIAQQHDEDEDSSAEGQASVTAVLSSLQHLPAGSLNQVVKEALDLALTRGSLAERPLAPPPVTVTQPSTKTAANRRKKQSRKERKPKVVKEVKEEKPSTSTPPVQTSENEKVERTVAPVPPRNQQGPQKKSISVSSTPLVTTNGKKGRVLETSSNVVSPGNVISSPTAPAGKLVVIPHTQLKNLPSSVGGNTQPAAQPRS